MSMTILDEVLARLDQCKGKWQEIATVSGLDYSWLTKLAQGKIHDPGIRKIERLKKHLPPLARDAVNQPPGARAPSEETAPGVEPHAGERPAGAGA